MVDADAGKTNKQLEFDKSLLLPAAGNPITFQHAMQWKQEPASNCKIFESLATYFSKSANKSSLLNLYHMMMHSTLHAMIKHKHWTGQM